MEETYWLTFWATLRKHVGRTERNAEFILNQLQLSELGKNSK